MARSCQRAGAMAGDRASRMWAYLYAAFSVDWGYAGLDGAGGLGLNRDLALQEHTDESSMVRVSSFDFLGSFLLMPLGLALAALLAKLLGTGRTLLLSGVVMVVGTAVSLLDRLMRALARQPASLGAALAGEVAA